MHLGVFTCVMHLCPSLDSGVATQSCQAPNCRRGRFAVRIKFAYAGQPIKNKKQTKSSLRPTAEVMGMASPSSPCLAVYGARF